MASRELFYLAYEDDAGWHRFESAYPKEELEQGKQLHQLITPNSFYRKKRSVDTLHTLYGISTDIDGVTEPWPVTHLDILDIWDKFDFTKPPSEIIYTSPGHYHLILKLKPVRAFPDRISYWQKCAKGLVAAFQNIGPDPQASANPVGFVRIPGHRNAKYYHRPLVETVFQSGSVFTLTEINEAVNGTPKEDKGNGVELKIEKLLKFGVEHGKRARGALTLSIYFNQHLGLSQEQTFEKIHEWNCKLEEPLKPYELKKAVNSAYKYGYRLSPRWLDFLTQDTPIEILKSYELAKQKEPLRTSLTSHAERITDFILSRGGTVETSQRKLARELNIPWRSYIISMKRITGLQIETIGRGRNAKSILRIRQEPKPKLAQINGAINGAETRYIYKKRRVVGRGAGAGDFFF